MTATIRALQNASFTTSKLTTKNESSLTKRSRRAGIYSAMLITDALAVFIGFLISNALLLDQPFASPGLKLGILSVPIFLALALNSNAYGRSALYKSIGATVRSIGSLFATLALILFILFGLSILKQHHPSFLAVGFLISSALIAGGRYVCHIFAKRTLGPNPLSELIIVDGVPHGPIFDQPVIDAKETGLHPDISDPAMLDRLGNLFRSIDRVIVACPIERHNDWALVLKSTGVTGDVYRHYRSAPAEANTIGPIHASQVKPLTRVQLWLKRLMDLIIVSIAILFLAPLMLVTAIAIKLESRGPVLFRQQRLGHGNRLFHIYKFRSMRDDLRDLNGDRSTGRDDDRITRVGRFIRATSIDELPQLFNVLLGTMSLVGPRPHALGSKADSKLFWEIDRNYWLRHATVPGLTGLAQVRGFRGATMTRADLEQRLASDLEYIQRWSLGYDLVILARTLGVIVHRNGF
ncbi:MAG: sugar transferase [Parasphingorhabdus sp.]|uniref:sugar transferase n=1 Tax=Parasphingorhabdus sp. TaxID=2709688 RepID=UPI003298854F